MHPDKKMPTKSLSRSLEGVAALPVVHRRARLMLGVINN